MKTLLSIIAALVVLVVLAALAVSVVRVLIERWHYWLGFLFVIGVAYAVHAARHHGEPR